MNFEWLIIVILAIAYISQVVMTERWRKLALKNERRRYEDLELYIQQLMEHNND